MSSRGRGINYYTAITTLCSRFPSDFFFAVGQTNDWAGGECPTVDLHLMPNPIIYKRAKYVKIVNNESPPQIFQTAVTANNTGGSKSDGTYTYRFSCYGSFNQAIESKSSRALTATITNSNGHGSVVFNLMNTVGVSTESVFPPQTTKFYVYRSTTGTPTLIAEVDIVDGDFPTTWTDDGSDPNADPTKEAPLGVESLYGWDESVSGLLVQRYYSAVSETEATNNSSRGLYLEGEFLNSDFDDSVTPFRAYAIYQGLIPKAGFENQDSWTPDEVEDVGNIMYVEHFDIAHNVYQGNGVSLRKVFQIGG